MKSLSFCAEEWLRKITTGISQDFGSFCIFLEEKSMIKHEKHLESGKEVSETFKEKVILDFACSGESKSKQQIPLFIEADKSADTRMCNVDIALISDKYVKVIIEIEETGIIPTKICGKFLTSAFSKYLVHSSLGDPIEIKDCLFIQILNDEKLKSNSKKKLQGSRIKDEINNMKDMGRIKEYELFWYKEIKTDGYKLLRDKISEYV